MANKRPHDQRLAEISRVLVPLRQLQDPIIDAVVERHMRMDIAARRELKDLQNQVALLGYATWASSSGLRIATELRRFWLEYFERFGRFGPESLPSSFNVLEAFFTFNTKRLTFELRPEREHLLSFSSYLDWYTASSFPEEPGCLVDVMAEGVIHAYDFILSSKEPLLSAGSSKLLLASGALIRHKDELSVLLLAGESPPRAAKMTGPHDIPLGGKEELKPASVLTPDHRLLEGLPDHSRVILATRFNLSNRSNDVRYLMLDQGDSYHVATDDFEMLKRSFGLRPLGHGYTEALDTEAAFVMNALFKAQIADLTLYADLFSVAASLMYLPVFFIAQAASCRDSEFLTTLGVEAKEPKARRVRKLLGDRYFRPRCTIRCLVGSQAHEPCDYKIQPPELKFETQGFWKPLGPDQIGSAPDGTPVMGKTWVHRTESWHSSSPEAFLARPAEEYRRVETQFIYVTRSPSHAADLYKVGMTTRDPTDRAGELSNSTATPLAFEILASWPVRNAKGAESKVHQALEQYRVSARREFFRAPLPVIIQAIDKVVAQQSKQF